MYLHDMTELNVTQNMKLVFIILENTAGKGENADYQPFLFSCSILCGNFPRPQN